MSSHALLPLKNKGSMELFGGELNWGMLRCIITWHHSELGFSEFKHLQLVGAAASTCCNENIAATTKRTNVLNTATRAAPQDLAVVAWRLPKKQLHAAFRTRAIRS